MQITKTNTNVTYLEKTTIHTLDVDGKKIKVREWFRNGDDCNDYEHDITILNQKDLTEIEMEAIGEEMPDLLDLKEKETLIINID
jgi:hypothetical protein